MEKAKLDEIRQKIAEEPKDSSSNLLEEVDRLRKANDDRVLADMRSFLRKEDLSDDEIEKVLVLVLAGKPWEHEQGNCRACAGTGRITESGCMGGRMVQCKNCKGQGQATRIKIP